MSSSASKGDFVFEKCDVSEWGDLKRLITKSVERFGEVSVISAECGVVGDGRHIDVQNSTRSPMSTPPLVSGIQSLNVELK